MTGSFFPHMHGGKITIKIVIEYGGGPLCPRSSSSVFTLSVIVPVQGLEVSIQSESAVSGPRHDTHSLVLPHPLLKEVGLAL